MKQSQLTRLLATTCLAFGLIGAGAQAADTQTSPVHNARIDDFRVGKKAIDEKNWQQARDSFTKVTKDDPNNADAFSYLGFANRWLNLYPEAFVAYDRALALNPEHKGALHYSGIGYLKTGQNEKALLQHERLQKVCANCEETAQLSKALVEAQLIVR
jgi:tetratricopeptide (TPR) repeat protein